MDGWMDGWKVILVMKNSSLLVSTSLKNYGGVGLAPQVACFIVGLYELFHVAPPLFKSCLQV
jgi:hypothetical protein